MAVPVPSCTYTVSSKHDAGELLAVCTPALLLLLLLLLLQQALVLQQPLVQPWAEVWAPSWEAVGLR